MTLYHFPEELLEGFSIVWSHICWCEVFADGTQVCILTVILMISHRNRYGIDTFGSSIVCLDAHLGSAQVSFLSRDAALCQRSTSSLAKTASFLDGELPEPLPMVVSAAVNTCCYSPPASYYTLSIPCAQYPLPFSTSDPLQKSYLFHADPQGYVEVLEDS